MGFIIALATACFAFVYLFAAREPLEADTAPEAELVYAKVPVDDHSAKPAA